MKKYAFMFICLLCCIFLRSEACTNIIVTRGASADGSCMLSYTSDSPSLYGELYFRPAARYKKGTMIKIKDWDTHKPLGPIAQVERTLQTMGNMNERQLIIGETTWEGREELIDTTGRIDYGSLIYLTLQRASSAREAISIIVELAAEYGYCSDGETFSLVDKNEAWIMDLIGKGPGGGGIVWVARRIPDGYISGHANLARIRTFPQDDPENCLYAPDVISLARSKGWFSGEDADFSFREAYCPLAPGDARGCDSRVWSAFNILCDKVFTCQTPDGEKSAPAGEWLNYAMGYDTGGELPLWVKPARKVEVKALADVMRDHYEGTPMDMTKDIGAGSNELPYRWRPLSFKYEGKTYCNERPISVVQTGFWFVAQARKWMPDALGALVWFGCDDTATSYLTPIYVSSTEVPDCLREGNGDILHYSGTSQFWINSRISNACYKAYNKMAPVVRARVDEYENYEMNVDVPRTDSLMLSLRGSDGEFSPSALRKVKKHLTSFSVGRASRQFEKWKALEELLVVKFNDGIIRAQNPDGSFVHSRYSPALPRPSKGVGYSDKWKEAVVKDHGSVLEVR